MNWETLGAFAEVIGVALILVSLAYVAAQMRQSNRFAQADAEREVLQQWNKALDGLAENAEITEIFLRGLADFDALDPVEKTRFSYKLIQLNVVYNAILEMTDKGLMSTTISDTAGDVVLSYITTPGGRKWWELHGPFQPNRAVINRRLETESGKFPSFFKTLPYHVMEDGTNESG